MNNHAVELQAALDWLRSFLVGRLEMGLGKVKEFEIGPLQYSPANSELAAFLKTYQPTLQEFTLIILALAPHLKPDFFNCIIAKYLPEGGDFPEFGGVRSAGSRLILPTGITAQFLLAGDNLEERMVVQSLLSGGHWLARKHVLWLEPVPEGEPLMSGRLILGPEVVEQLVTGTVTNPGFSIEFPAECIRTEMEWDDLVLHPSTLRQVHEIEHWINHNHTILKEWDMHKKIKPGYRVLFYGPPGTGKTLTATLLGKYTGRDVFRIDLSRVVSKYIGETEKNLARLFDKAENKNWILFFDEADSLFGKRTDIRDAHDKYANQEVSYLLQRVETFEGLVVLASNQRSNLDDAFTRRFHSIIQFSMPGPEERLQIWRKALPPQMQIAADIDLKSIAARFELAGAGILNVVHYCALEVLADQSLCLDLKRLEGAIFREFIKEGKIV
jgi:hypothetical protein